jgi:hypothetical protein
MVACEKGAIFWPDSSMRRYIHIDKHNCQRTLSECHSFWDLNTLYVSHRVPETNFSNLHTLLLLSHALAVHPKQVRSPPGNTDRRLGQSCPKSPTDFNPLSLYAPISHGLNMQLSMKRKLKWILTNEKQFDEIIANNTTFFTNDNDKQDKWQ